MSATEPQRQLSPIDELHRRIGRNLLMFQRIEQGLKFMLPYIHPDGGAKGADALRDYREGIKLETLGNLVKEFKQCAQGTPEWWETGLAELVQARNDLVHHFFGNQCFDLLSAQGLHDALAYLDQQYQAAREWSEIARVHSLLLPLILIDTHPEIAERFGAYREQLVAQLPSSVEIVDQGNPRGTVWASTRIVKLLRLAERHTDPVDGMTLLSCAGRFIKERAPEIRITDYGLRTLRQVLVASELFDVDGGSDGGAVRYRSKPEAAEWPLDLDAAGLRFTLARPR